MGGLKTEGIIFLTLAWGIIFFVAGYCYTKVFAVKKKK